MLAASCFFKISDFSGCKLSQRLPSALEDAPSLVMFGYSGSSYYTYARSCGDVLTKTQLITVTQLTLHCLHLVLLKKVCTTSRNFPFPFERFMWEPIKAERKRDEEPRMASYLRPKHVVSGTRILMLVCGGPGFRPPHLQHTDEEKHLRAVIYWTFNAS